MVEVNIGTGGRGGRCDLVPGLKLDGPARWTFLELAAGIDSEHEVLGCAQPLHMADEVLFSAKQRTLVTVRVKIPEHNLCLDVQQWAQLPTQQGVPRILSDQPFDVAQCVGRNYSASRDTLLVLGDAQHAFHASAWRIQVQEDLFILVDQADVIGWMLTKASHYLESPIAAGPPSLERRGTDSARRLLAEFLNVVDDAFVERLEVEDEAARIELADLEARAQREMTDGVHEILVAWIGDIVDRFYS